VLFPSTWCAAVAVPQAKEDGKCMSDVFIDSQSHSISGLERERYVIGITHRTTMESTTVINILVVDFRF